MTTAAEYCSAYILTIIPSSKAIVQKRDQADPSKPGDFYAWGSITYQEVK